MSQILDLHNVQFCVAVIVQVRAGDKFEPRQRPNGRETQEPRLLGTERASAPFVVGGALLLHGSRPKVVPRVEFRQFAGLGPSQVRTSGLGVILLQPQSRLGAKAWKVRIY